MTTNKARSTICYRGITPARCDWDTAYDSDEQKELSLVTRRNPGDRAARLEAGLTGGRDQEAKSQIRDPVTSILTATSGQRRRLRRSPPPIMRTSLEHSWRTSLLPVTGRSNPRSQRRTKGGGRTPLTTIVGGHHLVRLPLLGTPRCPSRRNLSCFVDLLLTWVAGIQIPHVISDAGYWNDWYFWLRGQDLNL
jgi:hypothetical protein